MPKLSLFTTAFLVLLISSCSTSPRSFDDVINGEIITQLNPYQRVPLGAQINFSTKVPSKVTLEVLGAHPVQRTFPSLTTSHQLPVLGLYAGRPNTVRIELETETGEIFSDSLIIETTALPDFFPEIEITKLDRTRMKDGMHLIDLMIANRGKFHSYTVIFDDAGEIRWYMDMSERGQITYTNHRLKNGNWLYLDWQYLLEVDDLGRTIKEEQIINNAGNHALKELPNGNLLIAGSMKDKQVLADGQLHTSRFDAAFIWDRGQGRTIREWDLRQLLDVDRLVFPPDFTDDYRSDWFHVNAIDYDPADNSLLLSGRSQGVIKVSEDNELIWIMAPRVSWGNAGPKGQGPPTEPYLLTPIDERGQPLAPIVQAGLAGTDNFEWMTGQHAVQLLENGHILLFDNGLARNMEPKPSYSRAVEYEVDDENRTIRQVWQYGKDRGLDMYSAITSDVDVLKKTNNRLITAGNIRAGQQKPHSKLIEITYPDNEVVFEAKVYFKDSKGNKERAWAQFDIVFKGERYDLIR